MATLADTTLVARSRAQDQQAFGELVGRYKSALESILLPLASDRDHAQDLVQETVLRAFKNLDRYEESHKFSTWFFRIGVNLAISARRRLRLEAKYQESIERNPGERHLASETPLETVLRDEDRARLSQSLAALPQHYVEVVEMRYGEGLGVKEIAKRVNKTPNTVSIILFRAKAKLKEQLGGT